MKCYQSLYIRASLSCVLAVMSSFTMQHSSTQLRCHTTLSTIRQASADKQPHADALQKRKPPCSTATYLHMHSPRPLPPRNSSLVVVSPIVWNSLPRNSAGMPTPVSATLMHSLSLSSSVTRTVMLPSVVNLSALLCVCVCMLDSSSAGVSNAQSCRISETFKLSAAAQ
jgi:hypothetical protein